MDTDLHNINQNSFLIVSFQMDQGGGHNNVRTVTKSDNSNWLKGTLFQEQRNVDPGKSQEITLTDRINMNSVNIKVLSYLSHLLSLPELNNKTHIKKS